MKRTLHQVVPGLIMAGAAAVPVVTMAEILTHAPAGGSTLGAQPSTAVAVAPSKSPAGAPPSASASSGGTQVYRGPVINDPFGGVQATITVSGNRITDVTISAPQGDPHSAAINQQAVPLLRRETLQAQSAQVNTVSGATLTSSSYAQSLQAAVSQAQSQGHQLAGTSTSSQAAGSPSTGTNQAPAVSVSGDD